MSAEIHTLDPNNRSEDVKLKALVASIKNCLNEKLSELLAQMFNSADDALFRLAENAETNEEQTQYFDTMRMLRLERKNIGKLFAEALRSYLRPPSDEAEAEDGVDDDELSLVDQDEMEEMVAISTMQSRAMNAFGDSVNHLEARLEVLAMKSPSTIDKQALIPKNICESFQQALASVELNTRNKLIIYKLFDQEVCSQLGDLYQALNKILIDENILPQIKLDKPNSRESLTSHTVQPPMDHGEVQNNNINARPPTAGPAQSPTGSGSYMTGHSQGQGLPDAEVSRVVSQFISGEVIAQGPGIPSSFSMPPLPQGAASSQQYYDRRDVLKALSNLQSNFIQQNEVTEFVDAETFKRALMIDMGSRHGGTLTKRVNQVDEKTIDFIEMLFEVIVEDKSISEIVTNLLLRLQIPVIKVAMLDQDFFNSNEHPARKLLNLIALIGTGISEKSDEVYIRLEKITDHLLEEFDVEIVSFQLAVDQLNELINDEQEITEKNEKQTQKQVMQEHARQIVLAELQYLVSNRTLPKAVHPLVLKHWSTLMFHRYIRHGKGSDEWNQSISTLRQLLNSLQPVNSKAQWLRLNETHVDISNAIREALYDTNQNKVVIDDALDALQETYSTLLTESEYRIDKFMENNTDDNIILDDTGAFDALPEIEPEFVDISPLEEQAEEAREKISRLPSEVRPGVWFAIFDGEEHPLRRLKLSVIIMEEAKLVFVDRHGIKVLEKDAAIFADELENELSSQIADHSVFDHALSQVITCLSAAC